MPGSSVLIITGCASGIGLATSAAALHDGARVFGIDVSPAPESIKKHPCFRFFQGDLTNGQVPNQAVTACIEAFGRRIDGLLNIAGVSDHFASVDGISDVIWHKCFAVNLTAPVMLMREVVPIMREQKSGSIVNVSSKAGISGAAAGVAYTASKHGLIGVTKNVAWRFRSENIRCNAICPGGVNTGFCDGLDSSLLDMTALATMKPIHSSVSEGQDGEGILPKDIAQTLLFLVSNQSKWINGAIGPIDNAWSTI